MEQGLIFRGTIDGIIVTTDEVSWAIIGALSNLATSLEVPLRYNVGPVVHPRPGSYEIVVNVWDLDGELVRRALQELDVSAY